ncbi:MAG: hypothetical protein ACOX8W_09330 [bacterium]|jgi:competence protein ComGC
MSRSFKMLLIISLLVCLIIPLNVMADSGKKDFVNIIPRELTKQEISQADSESAMQMQTINAWVEEHYSNQIP